MASLLSHFAPVCWQNDVRTVPSNAKSILKYLVLLAITYSHMDEAILEKPMHIAGNGSQL